MVSDPDHVLNCYRDNVPLELLALLHMTIDPDAVVAAIDELLDEVGVTTGPSG